MTTTSISIDVLQDVFRPIIATLYFLALIPTIFRLGYRGWVRQLWWDDMWAAFSMINATLLFATYFRTTFHFTEKSSASYLDFIYISTLLTTNFALWSARLSVAVTIVRVIATGKMKIISKIVAVVFGLFSIGLMVQKLIICGPPSSVKFLCSNPNITGYSELVTSIVADLWLLLAPAYLLWKMNLRKRHHRLLQAIFACEILVLTASLAHSVYIVRKDYILQAVTSHFEIAISHLVCNLLFLVTYIYRIFRNGEETRDVATTSAPSRHTDPLGSSQYSNVMSSLGPLSSVDISYSNSSSSGTESSTGALCATDPGPGGAGAIQQLSYVEKDRDQVQASSV
ncbi:hypothetical protein BDQ17DRAFT_1431901 [Cyathus striatus]|nr:hypothetical protein BDQ17DRAFT_1431901 [Cyathus striatus]